MKKIDWLKVIRFICLVSGCCILIMFLISAAASVLVMNELLLYENVAWLQMIIKLAVVLAACLLSAQKAGHGKMVVSILTALVLVGCLVIVKVLFYPDCKFDMGWDILLMFIAAVLAGLISGRKRTRR